jgi:hypothetical protein
VSSLGIPSEPCSQHLKEIFPIFEVFFIDHSIYLWKNLPSVDALRPMDLKYKICELQVLIPLPPLLWGGIYSNPAQ